MIGGLNTVATEAGHVAACPDVDPVSCAEEALPAHRHDLRTRQLRASLGAQLGVGHGWQVALNLPYELRDVQVAYSTLDGATYDPPYEDIHHRAEILHGFADGELKAQWLHRGAGPLLRAEGGLSLPFGSTEADPYASGAAGQWHQHNQLGTGLPLILWGGGLLWAPDPWGGQIQLNGRMSFWENGRGFQAPNLYTVGAGPLWRFAPKFALLSLLSATWEGPERWSGVEYGGRFIAQVSGGVEWAFGPRGSVILDLRQPVYQYMAEYEHGDQAKQEGELRIGPLVGLVLAWTGRKPGP